MAEAYRLPLEHKDIIPQCTVEAGFISRAEYERFDQLVHRANLWLQLHPHVKVRTCESIEIKRRYNTGGTIDTEKVTYQEYGKHRNEYIRALRLWIAGKDPDDQPEPHQLGYVNVVPNCTEEAGFFSAPKYESFGDAINRFNQQIKQQPLPGKILCVETQDMKSSRWCADMDPDRSYWTESGRTVYYVNVIRIFFTRQEPAHEEIGCSDFVPEIIQEGGLMSTPIYQPFSLMVPQARRWLSKQSGIRVVNLQSIDYKLKNAWNIRTLDTHRTSYYEDGTYKTHYLRILRVCYTRTMSDPNPPAYTDLWMPKLTVRTFSPVQLSADLLTNPRFESMSDTIVRVRAWLETTRVRVISAETVPIRLRSGNQHGKAEQVFTWNRGNRTETILFVVRIYLNDDYREPPLEALPSVPEMQEECCRIL